MYLSSTVFHSHIFTCKFLRSTLFKRGILLLCTTPSSALGHHVTPIQMLRPLASTQCLQHSPWADAGVQNVRIQLAYEHVNNSSFRVIYHNRNNQLTVDSHWPIHWNHLVTRSHSGVAVQSSLVIFVFWKQFYSLWLLSCNIQCSAHSTHSSLYNKSPWSIKGHTTHYGMELKAMPQSPNISPCNKYNWCLTQSTRDRTGHLLNTGAVSSELWPLPYPLWMCSSKNSKLTPVKRAQFCYPTTYA